MTDRFTAPDGTELLAEPGGPFRCAQHGGLVTNFLDPHLYCRVEPGDTVPREDYENAIQDRDRARKERDQLAEEIRRRSIDHCQAQGPFPGNRG